MYPHINRVLRIALCALLYSSHSQTSAARELGINPSTVGREIKRNAKEGGRYQPTRQVGLAESDPKF